MKLIIEITAYMSQAKSMISTWFLPSRARLIHCCTNTSITTRYQTNPFSLSDLLSNASKKPSPTIKRFFFRDSKCKWKKMVVGINSHCNKHFTFISSIQISSINTYNWSTILEPFNERWKSPKDTMEYSNSRILQLLKLSHNNRFFILLKCNNKSR